MSFSTGYYTYGQMNATLITLCIGAVMALELLTLVVRRKFPDALVPKLLTYGITALLAYCAMTLLGDRVEAIGTTILTDYDSGHGGEEAIYFSIGALTLWLIAVIFNIMGSFEKPEEERKSGLACRIAAGCAALVLCLGVVGVTLQMTGVVKLHTGDTKTAAGTTSHPAASTYAVSYSLGNGNTDDMPDYQFLCSNFEGMVKADSRFYVDVSLELDGSGNYILSTDSYVIESGHRAAVGDDTGLGLVLTMNATGTYTDNGDGTYTTSVPTHAVFEMQTDTYSSQMKSAAQMNVDGNDADGVYDSNDIPAVLDFVPETVFTLKAQGRQIVSWTVAETEEMEENAETVPTGEDADGTGADAEGVTVISEDGSTTLTFRADGSYRFFFEAYGVEDLGTYTYADGLLTLLNAAGAESAAGGDPLKLHYVSAVSDQLTGDYTISADALKFEKAN